MNFVANEAAATPSTFNRCHSIAFNISPGAARERLIL
jgi:hypothetical protein